LEKGFAKSGKKREDFEISYPIFVVTGNTEEQFQGSKIAAARQIAFYGSTPAYQPVLDSIGAGDLQPILNKMSKQGRWEEMGELISDDILTNFAIVGEPSQIASQLLRRYGDIVDRTSAAYANLSKDDRQSIITELTNT